LGPTPAWPPPPADRLTASRFPRKPILRRPSPSHNNQIAGFKRSWIWLSSPVIAVSRTLPRLGPVQKLIPVWLSKDAAKASRFRIGTHSKRFATGAQAVELAKPLECAAFPRFVPPVPHHRSPGFKMSKPQGKHLHWSESVGCS